MALALLGSVIAATALSFGGTDASGRPGAI
jgi:hypothetical protein